MTQDYQNNNDTDLEENFADIFEESFIENHDLDPGQIIEAEIVKISDEWIFLNIGRKSEGHLEAKELTDENGNLKVKEGDVIKAFFMSSKDGEMLFTTRISGNDAGIAVLKRAFENKIPIEGFVEKEIKGGYQIKIGDLRAFCPFSQMGLSRNDNPKTNIGQHLSFIITEFNEKDRNIILSNRAILEEENKAQLEILKESLQEGMKVNGVVKSILDFGAFVDIGGVQALLPISEISRSRVNDINKYLELGQEIDAAILKLDWDRERITISMKEIQPDPWEYAERKYLEGSCHTGEIARLTNFGAFVTLESGLDGLIHISDLGRNSRIKHPRDVVSLGQSIEVKINSVDIRKKRISLIPVEDLQEEDNYQQFMDKNDNSYKALGSLGDLLKEKLDKKS
ncbi:MAG: 30S ribosomal protein S1 [Spirochaetota bacterium]|nr:30S ribosomal protein S1 [Spirochaetota bacterium]